MPVITRDLLRKRSEHNEGIISTMEEVTLHQEEIEAINEVLGMTCRKLKILYLQNNIIRKMENLNHLKELEYVNLALNNITKIEGLQNCEFLKKLDMTVNFIDLDELKSSLEHLQPRDRLRDFYLMGNPAEANWAGFKTYVIAKLPQLTNLDGTDITRSMLIKAQQELPRLEKELRGLAKLKRAEKAAAAELDENGGQKLDPDELTENTPEVRDKIYRELAEQKKEKEDRENEHKPKDRNYEKEQAEAIKQKNEGGWAFQWDEEVKPGMLVLTVPCPRHLDSSLIDVDTLRLKTLCEVKAEDSKCQRAKADGNLMVIMPKVNFKENVFTSNTRDGKVDTKINPLGGNGRTMRKSSTASKFPKKLSMQEQMIADAMAACGTGGATAGVTKSSGPDSWDHRPTGVASNRCYWC
eukprot:GSChrysophyteH2.ASY1.ANO1.1162.1 assembled CDS